MSAESAKPKNNGRGSISCRSSQRDASAAADRQTRQHRVRRGKAEKLCANLRLFFAWIFCFSMSFGRNSEPRSSMLVCPYDRGRGKEEEGASLTPSPSTFDPFAAAAAKPCKSAVRSFALSLSSTAVTKARVLLELKRVIHFATQNSGSGFLGTLLPQESSSSDYPV